MHWNTCPDCPTVGKPTRTSSISTSVYRSPFWALESPFTKNLQSIRQSPNGCIPPSAPSTYCYIASIDSWACLWFFCLACGRYTLVSEQSPHHRKLQTCVVSIYRNTISSTTIYEIQISPFKIDEPPDLCKCPAYTKRIIFFFNPEGLHWIVVAIAASKNCLDVHNLRLNGFWGKWANLADCPRISAEITASDSEKRYLFIYLADRVHRLHEKGIKPTRRSSRFWPVRVARIGIIWQWWSMSDWWIGLKFVRI